MQESRIKNSSRNFIFALLFQIVKILLVFVNRIIFVRILGASYLGVNGLFTNILSILSLADLGMTTAMMYCLYKPLADKDEKKIAQYMNYFKKVYSVIALAVTAFGIILIPFLKFLVNLPSDMPNIYLYYILLLANTVISYLFVYQTTLVSADQKNYLLNKYDIIFQFILFGLQIAVLFVTKSFALYLLSNVLCTFICNLIKVKISKKLYPYLEKYKEETLSKKERKKLYENIFSLFFYKLGGVIQSNTDNILISIFVGTITVGYYSNYSTIILSITSFLTMAFTSIKASLGNFVAEKEQKEQLKMFNRLEVYNFWLVGFCTVCFIVLIPDFVRICFGEEYLLSLALLICAVANFYTSNIRQTLWAYRETTGLFKKTKFITIITAIINVFLSILLGYYYGLVGIVLATVIGRMVYAWWKEPMITFNEYFKTSPKDYYITYIKRAIFIIGLCTFMYILCNMINLGNIYISFVVKMFICAILPNLVFYLVYRKHEAIIYIKNNLLKGLKR